MITYLINADGGKVSGRQVVCGGVFFPAISVASSVATSAASRSIYRPWGPIIRPFYRLRIVPLHPAGRLLQFLKSVLAVQLVCILGCQHPSAESLKLRVRNDDFHQPLAKTLAA